MSDIVWRPSNATIRGANLTHFAHKVGRAGSYEELWKWSVNDVDAFWTAIVEHFDIRFHDRSTRVRSGNGMPGTDWFRGATLNFAEHVFAGKDDDALAIQFASELHDLAAWTWGDLRRETARVRSGLVDRGVGVGDVVAAYLPNCPETVAAFLATASLGAIWTSAAPEFGARAVIDRFAQVEPRVFLASDGYRYGGRDFDCADKVADIEEAIGTSAVRLRYLTDRGWDGEFIPTGVASPLEFVPVPFAHPLWVLYSSGTTGLPKAIVHSQGGVLLEMTKHQHLHLDAKPDDRIFWFTTTGWMMWNFLVSVLLTDASIVLYDGNPATPSLDRLWDLAADAGVTTFGTSPAFLTASEKAGVRPASGRDLSTLRSIGATGSPVSRETYAWVRDQLGERIWVAASSGGTDVCTAFLTGVPTLPVYAGEMQARALGVRAEAYDETGRSIVGHVGELVITAPMPSMPIGLWNDPTGERLRETYFDHFPGVWRHGDWVEITERGTAVISGRSDATINRGGVRIDSSEIYRVVLAHDAVVDALVVDVPREGAGSHMPLFVVLRPGLELSDELARVLRDRIRRDCSPRHVPDEVIRVAEVPRTLSGKVLEVPVKRVLMGEAPDDVASGGSLANPQALEQFAAVRLAAGRDSGR